MLSCSYFGMDGNEGHGIVTVNDVMEEKKEFQPGSYRLTRDLPAVHPDMRVTRDWRANSMKAGQIFCIEPITYGSDNAVIGYSLFKSGYYAHYGVTLRARSRKPSEQARIDALLAALEPVTEDVELFYNRVHFGWSGPGCRVLQALVDAGRVTMDEVRNLSGE